MKIYLSSPFFNEEEITNMRKAQEILEQRGFDVYVPMDNQIETPVGEKHGVNVQWAKDTFMLDKIAIDNCDIVVLLYYGMYSDSGTAWEGGYAYGKNIPIILVHCQTENKNNLMMTNGSHTNLESIDSLKTYDFETLPKTEFYGYPPQS